MDQNELTEAISTENKTQEKKSICIWSLIALIVSLAAFGSYCLVLGLKIKLFIYFWVVLGIVSVFLPSVAKHKRLSNDQAGRSLEITAIGIGGFVFAVFISILTNWSMYLSYMGWIVGGLIYRAVKY